MTTIKKINPNRVFSFPEGC